MTRTFLIHQNGSAAHQRSASQCTFALLIIVSSRCIKLLFVISSRWVAHPFSRLAHTTTIMVVYIYQYCMRYSSTFVVYFCFLPSYTHPCHTPTCPASHHPQNLSSPQNLTRTQKVEGSSPTSEDGICARNDRVALKLACLLHLLSALPP